MGKPPLRFPCSPCLRERPLPIGMKPSASYTDVTIDGTGNSKVIEAAYDLAKLRGGRCVLFGVMPSDQRVSVYTLPLHFGRTLTGSEGGQSRPHEDIPKILGQIAAGAFDPSDFINRRGSLSGVGNVMADMRKGEVIHAVLVF